MSVIPTKLPAVSRRTLVFGGASALAMGVLTRGHVVETFAADPNALSATPGATPAAKGNRSEDLAKYGYVWAAPSPATHKGDRYKVVVRNSGTAPVDVLVRASLTGRHRERTRDKAKGGKHGLLVDQAFTLAPGEQKELTVSNVN